MAIKTIGLREGVCERLKARKRADESFTDLFDRLLALEALAVGRHLQGAFDRAEIGSTFDWMTVVPFESEHAYVAEALEAELRQNHAISQEDVNARLGDLCIAAVADSENATVVTRDTEDFELLGVPVEAY